MNTVKKIQKNNLENKQIPFNRDAVLQMLLDSYVSKFKCENVNNLMKIFLKIFINFHYHRGSQIRIKKTGFNVLSRYSDIDFSKQEEFILTQLELLNSVNICSMITLDIESKVLLEVIGKLNILKNRDQDEIFSYITLFTAFIINNEKSFRIFGKKIVIDKITGEINY